MVKVVALGEDVVLSRGIGDAVENVEHPDGKAECSRRAPWEGRAEAAGQEDRPQGRDARCIQTQEMPGLQGEGPVRSRRDRFMRRS